MFPCYLLAKRCFAALARLREAVRCHSCLLLLCHRTLALWLLYSRVWLAQPYGGFLPFDVYGDWTEQRR